jgi:hypothetical protein
MGEVGDRGRPHREPRRRTGRVIGREDVDGRRSLVLGATDSDPERDTVFTLRIDIETGVVLRIEDLRIGTVDEL